MRSKYIIMAVVAVTMFSSCAPGIALSLTTYNMLGRKYDARKSPWSDRVEAIDRMIHREDNHPDILACQEVFDSVQVNDLLSMLSDEYDSRILEKEVSARAVFWKRDKFRELEHYELDMLADHPEYGAKYYTSRFANVVRLCHNKTGRELLACNWHARANDAKDLTLSKWIRYHEASALAEFAKAKADSLGGIPVIVMGDFNGYIDNGDTIVSSPSRLVELGFADAFGIADRKINAGYTCHYDKTNLLAGTVHRCAENARLDYIMVYPSGSFKVRSCGQIIDFIPGSDSLVVRPVPSDHNPTHAEMIMK